MMTAPGDRTGAGAADVRHRHIPVLLSQVLAAIGPEARATVIDATFGAGGYTRALLEAGAGRVIAIDRDAHAIAAGSRLVADFPGRLDLVHARFAALDAVARGAGVSAVDAVVLDVGVSSMQLDEPGRGFSFQHDGPLDMRMSPGEGMSAADVVNRAREEEIADILFHLGDERRSRAIARAIVAARQARPLATTRELAQIVARVLGRPKGQDTHPATRTFQALRIFVNDELAELARALQAAERILHPGGRLAVVSFHSLEDRIVKQVLAARAGRTPAASRHAPAAKIESPPPSFRIVNQRPFTSSQEEIAANPRARSARLRAAERTAAPAWPAEDPAALGIPQLGGLPRRAR
jgi:16S rRNA (cytosine1402-N4)-methyltransferase